MIKNIFRKFKTKDHKSKTDEDIEKYTKDLYDKNLKNIKLWENILNDKKLGV